MLLFCTSYHTSYNLYKIICTGYNLYKIFTKIDNNLYKALILLYSFLLDTRDIFFVLLFVFLFTNVPGVLFREICNSVFMCTPY